jgi:hypothetical protein
MRMQGLGEGSHMAGWGLAHYLVGDWTRWAFLGPLEKEKGTDVPRRIQLWTEREIAVTVNPATPDPVALWQGAGEVSNLEGLPLENLLQPPMCKMEFAACGLPLKAGSNQVTVSFEQPVGIVGAHMPTGELYGKPIGAISGAVNEFSFILRTARFWRSFGKLNVTVTLPAGTKYAACSLPGAQVNTAGQGGTVTYSGEGLPARNLHVIFAAFQPAPDPDRKHRSASYGPGIAADQAPLGTPPGDLAEVLARVPARGAVPQSALRVGGTVPAGVPVNACLVGGIAGAAVVVGAVALVMVRRRRLV